MNELVNLVHSVQHDSVGRCCSGNAGREASVEALDATLRKQFLHTTHSHVDELAVLVAGQRLDKQTKTAATPMTDIAQLRVANWPSTSCAK